MEGLVSLLFAPRWGLATGGPGAFETAPFRRSCCSSLLSCITPFVLRQGSKLQGLSHRNPGIPWHVYLKWDVKMGSYLDTKHSEKEDTGQEQEALHFLGLQELG